MSQLWTWKDVLLTLDVSFFPQVKARVEHLSGVKDNSRTLAATEIY
jgi:hypothetical protein